MRVVNTHIVNHVEKVMGSTYSTISKVYECVGGEYFIEQSGKTSRLKRITKKDFEKLQNTPLDEYDSLD